MPLQAARLPDIVTIMNKALIIAFTSAAALAVTAFSASAQTAPRADPPAAAGKITLKVVRVDSEETAGEDGKGTRRRVEATGNRATNCSPSTSTTITQPGRQPR